jgi:dipeptidyl-peptidase 4
MLDLAAAAGPDDVEYLARVAWDVEPLLVGMQPRDQRALHVLALEGDALRSVRRIVGEPWVELVPGAPAWLDGLLTVEDVAAPDGTLRRALCRDGEPLTPQGIEVRAHARGAPSDRGRSAGTVGTVVLSVSHDDPTSVDVVERAHRRGRRRRDGVTDGRPGAPRRALRSPTRADPTSSCVAARSLDEDLPRITMEVHATGAEPVTHVLPSVGETSGLDVCVTHARARRASPARGARHAGRIPRSPRSRCRSCSIPTVGRMRSACCRHAPRTTARSGSPIRASPSSSSTVAARPGRGPGFEHEVHGDLASLALADQIDALDALGQAYPLLDVARVGIRGWSYGGTLAALAALQTTRPHPLRDRRGARDRLAPLRHPLHRALPRAPRRGP